MSEIVKDGNSFGIKVPICAGIKDSQEEPSELIKGQLVVTQTPSSSSDPRYNTFGENAPMYTTDPGGNIKSVNKILPIRGKNIYIAPKGTTNVNEKTVIGRAERQTTNGFEVMSQISVPPTETPLYQGGGLKGTGVENSIISTFTADTVRIILESDSYGNDLSSVVSPAEGQIFFLITEPENGATQ